MRGVLLAAPVAVFVGATSLIHPLAPLALVVGGFGALFFARSPFLFLCLFVIMLYTRPGDFFPVLDKVQLGKLSAFGALGLLGAGKLLDRDLSWATVPQNKWMIALTLAVLASVVVSVDAPWSQAVFKDVFVKIVIIYVLIINLVDRPERVVAFQVVLGAATTFLACYAIYGRVSGLNTWEGTRTGGIGLLGDPNDLALTLLTTMPFVLLAALRTVGAARVAFGAMFGLSLVAVLFTQSRGGLLGLVAGMAVLFRHRVRNKAVWVALGVVAIVGLAAVSGVTERAAGGGLDESASNRLDAWKAGFRMFLDHPVAGIGIECFPQMYPSYATEWFWRTVTAHNTWVQVLAETGVLGIVPFAMLIWLTVLAAWKMERAAGPPGLHQVARQAFLPNFAALMTAAFFLSQGWLWFIYVNVALIAAADRVGRATEVT